MSGGELIRRLRALFDRDRQRDDLDEEMRLHLSLRAERLAAPGQSSADAERAARRRFGNPLRLREDAMDAGGWRWLEQFGQDLRFGARSLRRNPAFAATAVLSLALATGAATAIFSVLDGVVLRPLPFEEPDQLVQIFGRNWREERGTPDPMTAPVPYSEMEQAAREATTLAGFAAYNPTTAHLQGSDGVERLSTVAADLSLFEILRATPIAGRTFRGDDSREVAVISERLWRERFGAAAVPSLSLTLDGKPFAVIGVMPERFEFPYRIISGPESTTARRRTDIWIPLQPVADANGQRRIGGRLDVVARLRRGATLEQADAELAVIASRMEQQRYAGTKIRVGFRPSPLADAVSRSVRQSLWMLLVSAALVLLTACLNVANLLLARMSVRAREVVTRAALGAGTLRLVRQFLAESLLLSFAGGVLGLACAYWATQAIVLLYGGRLPRAQEVGLHWQSFAFLFASSLATGALFGMAPAFAATRLRDVEITKEAGGHATVSRKARGLRSTLVVLEVAAAFVLAVGAAVVFREIVRLERLDTGMTTDHVVVLHMTPRTDAADYYAIESRVAALPGVRGAGFIQFVPLQNWGWSASFEIRGRPTPPGERYVTDLRYVTPGYFQTLGIPIVRGRGFTASDTQPDHMVVVVNEALAKRYFPGEDPIGRELDRGTIVGIARDVRSEYLGRPAQPELYYAAAQNIAMTSDVGMSLVVRTGGPPEGSIAAIRDAVRQVNPRLAIFNVRTMEQVRADSLWQLHLYRWLVGSFAILTVVLAAVGLYGLIAYTASARTREFAIRLALGSDRGALSRLVLQGGARLTLAGLAAGVVCLLAVRWWAGQLPADLRIDTTSAAAVTGLLAAISLLACAVPARRAAAVDPSAALRQD